ncbi:MAG: uncharacterized protein KVP18_003950 [Porospora cf. gigantea A]|uniref:uncharacterized protein n=1 Tax=Porospora cf. gigantea A TaxID=2853593 RepID=UPI0035599EC1|nr:MAG: hypothetical protein KVP18_003950 [Porospora cf. gigantea A]
MVIKLTATTTAGGCGCKLPQKALTSILDGVPQVPAAALSFPALNGFEGSEDASAVQLPSGGVLLNTTDFFTPVVDDAKDWGRIAATNAISDIYAVGGQPVTALAMLMWPATLPLELATSAIAGAQEKCEEAGICIGGGHSITGHEPVFGLTVSGYLPSPDQVIRNCTPCDGDVLCLTKPLGTGVITTAHKRGAVDHISLSKAIKWMTTLNQAGQGLRSKVPAVHAMSDVTGFGLAGHLLEMITSQFQARITMDALPLMDGFEGLQTFPGGLLSNRAHYGTSVVGQHPLLHALFDPQTSGGLLIAVAPEGVLALRDVTPLWVIGSIESGDGKIFVE